MQVAKGKRKVIYPVVVVKVERIEDCWIRDGGVLMHPRLSWTDSRSDRCGKRVRR